jgi:hypothetical protein
VQGIESIEVWLGERGLVGQVSEEFLVLDEGQWILLLFGGEAPHCVSQLIVDLDWLAAMFSRMTGTSQVGMRSELLAQSRATVSRTPPLENRSISCSLY